MPKALSLDLSNDERRELEWVRDHHKLSHVREKAAALLKIHEGMSGRQVALSGLLKHRRPDTIYEWVHRYQAEGIEGLKVKPGRGRKPARESFRKV